MKKDRYPIRIAASLTAALSLGGGLSGCGQSAPADNTSSADSNVTTSTANSTTIAGQSIKFGILGDPQQNAGAWDGADPEFSKESVQAKLRMFRKNERSPSMDQDGPVTWMQIEERESLQRALFYAVEAAAPGLITKQDRRWLKSDEKYLVESECENRGADGTMYNLTDEQCAGAASSPNSKKSSDKAAEVDSRAAQLAGAQANWNAYHHDHPQQKPSAGDTSSSNDMPSNSSQ